VASSGEAAANEARERRELARVARALSRAHPMHSGSGTTSDISRCEPFDPKPVEVGRVSSSVGESRSASPDAWRAAADLVRSKERLRRRGEGARKRWCLWGENEMSEAGTLWVNAPPARAYRRGRTGAGSQHHAARESGSRPKRCAQRRSAEVGNANSNAIEPVPPRANRERSNARNPHRGETRDRT
jgi:hypothetical protein